MRLRNFCTGTLIAMLFCAYIFQLSETFFIRFHVVHIFFPPIIAWYWYKGWLKKPHWTILGLSFLIFIVGLQSWYTFWNLWVVLATLLFFGSVKTIDCKHWTFYTPLLFFLAANLIGNFSGYIPAWGVTRAAGVTGNPTILGAAAALLFLCVPWYWSIVVSLPLIALSGSRGPLLMLGFIGLLEGRAKLVLVTGMVIAALLFIPGYVDNDYAHRQQDQPTVSVYEPGHRLLDEGIEQKLIEIQASFSRQDWIGRGWGTIRFYNDKFFPHSSWIAMLEELGWILGILALVFIALRLRGQIGFLAFIYGATEIHLWGAYFGLALLALVMGYEKEKDVLPCSKLSQML